MLMWKDGEFVEENKVSTLNWTLHYSGSVWEGIRSYQDDNGNSNLFMLDRHIDRLFESAKILFLNIPYTNEELMTACQELQNQNGNKELYFRPIVYRKKDAENDSQKTVGVDIYAFELVNQYRPSGIKVVSSGHIRSYPEFEMQCKSSNNYGKLGLWREESFRLGVDEVLLKDKNGYYTEAPTANLFVVLSSGEIITPPSDGSILPGITRSLVGQQLEAVEKVITRPDLVTAQEIFLTGTYAEVTPIIEFDGHIIGTGQIGPVVELTQKWYKKVVKNQQWHGTTGQ